MKWPIRDFYAFMENVNVLKFLINSQKSVVYVQLYKICKILIIIFRG